MNISITFRSFMLYIVQYFNHLHLIVLFGKGGTRSWAFTASNNCQ